MAQTATMKLSLTLSGLPTGTDNVAPSEISFSAANGAREFKNLSSGDNTITLPTTPNAVTAVLIIPPSANTQAITLKGAGGDTGISLSKTKPTWIHLGTAPASFILNAGGTVTGLCLVWV
jgi:hypothetical protein